MRELGGERLFALALVLLLGAFLGLLRIPQHVLAVPGPFGGGQRCDGLRQCHSRGTGIVRARHRVQQTAERVHVHADARNRQPLPQFVGVQNHRQCTGGVGGPLTGQHAEQRLAGHHHDREPARDLILVAARRHVPLVGGLRRDRRLHGLQYGTYVGVVGRAGIAQCGSGVRNQRHVAGLAVVGHQVVGVVRGEQRVHNRLRTAGDPVGTLVHVFGVGHGHVLAGHHRGHRAGDAHLQVLRVLGVVVHLHGVGQRPQRNQPRRSPRRLTHGGQRRDPIDHRLIQLEFRRHVRSFALGQQPLPSTVIRHPSRRRPMFHCAVT